MNILLVNDDGYLAPGINAFKKILEKYGKVYVVAPHNWQSGKSVGITFFQNLPIHKIHDTTWSVEGTPADCVIVANLVIKEKIDLVVSGVNNGYNLSYDSMYSGTCGACYQALMYKMKAIAFSVEKFFGEDQPQINEDMEEVFKYILDNNLTSEDYFLNVNMQEPQYSHPKGIRFTRLYPRLSLFKMEPHNIPKHVYKVQHHYETPDIDLNYDITATKNGYVSITPLTLPICDLKALDELKGKDVDYATR